MTISPAVRRPYRRCYSTTEYLLLFYLLISLSSPSSHAVDPETDDGREEEVQWQILTKHNFSSQIRLNPHLLMIVTVPWSGESRSLMKELAHAVTKKNAEFSTLKLMVIHRNNDRMLADALDATMGVNVICYHHSLSYKYRGQLRVQNILSSVHYLMSLLPEEIPLKSLRTVEELAGFVNSTDKTLLILEFCGWTPKLMAKVMSNGSENAFGALLSTSLNGETNETMKADVKENQKMMENEKIKCGTPGLNEFSPLNDSDILEAESTKASGVSCSFEEFRQFESFLSNFTAFVREFFLPPERLKFGLVSERSLISRLGVEDTGSWLMMLYFAGCPGCGKVLKGGDLQRVLEIHVSPVTELKRDEHDLYPGLPSDRPSILLFIDRSSDSLKIRRKSKEALDVFRELALHNHIPYKMSGQNSAKPQKPSSSRTISGHPKLELSTLSQKVTVLKDKISIMVMNEGKHITLDRVASQLQGSSLQEVLTYILQQKKEIKLSSLAKDVGFQLLSDDIDVKMRETSLTETEVQSSQQSAEPSGEHEMLSEPTAAEHSTREGKKSYIDTSEHLPVKTHDLQSEKLVGKAIDEEVEEGTFSEEKGLHQLNLIGCNCSFFFSDGQFQLLESLVGLLKIPSLVIVDPLSHQHYVFAEEADFSYSSLSSFLNMFKNGSLLPYQRSESVTLDSREAPHPPFVNLDFHEVDSIPRVSAHKFMKLVVGSHSDSLHAGNAWKKDVLVLFSSSWCGFCQRMELAVREVYQAFKGYSNMMKNQFRNAKSLSGSDGVNDTLLKLPVVYVMDCIRNDCSSILKSINKRKLYPSLLLFPAERKEAVSYEGDISVLDIIKFIADQGGNSHWLYRERGILWAEAQQGAGSTLNDMSETLIHDDASITRGSHEILLKDRTHTRKPEVESNNFVSYMQYDSGTVGPEVSTGSILVATDKLLNVYPFDRSKILIVKVNQSTGFQGLIINKRISWDAINELEEGLESLKEAPLSYGGPVIARGLPLVSLTRQSSRDQHPEILPDIYFLDQWATVTVVEGIKSRNQSMIHYWFFLGYSSWGWDQLFDEIADGAWNVINGDVEQFDWPMT